MEEREIKRFCRRDRFPELYQIRCWSFPKRGRPRRARYSWILARELLHVRVNRVTEALMEKVFTDTDYGLETGHTKCKRFHLLAVCKPRWLPWVYVRWVMIGKKHNYVHVLPHQSNCIHGERVIDALHRKRFWMRVVRLVLVEQTYTLTPDDEFRGNDGYEMTIFREPYNFSFVQAMVRRLWNSEDEALDKQLGLTE